MSANDMLELPYDQRRLVVVTDKAPAGSRQMDALTARLRDDKVLSAAALGALAVFAPLVPAAAAVIEIVAARQALSKDGQDLLPVSWADAKALRFPVGHPRKNAVYVGHPVDPATYIPISDFHRFLFEHKVAEAQRLIRSLGAVTVDVIRVEGWDQTAGVSLGLSVPTLPGAPSVDAKVSAGREATTGRTVLATMRLNPTKAPHIPDGLVWFAHEPLWREVAEARLESGLDAFVIDVRSTDDYGINAGLKAKIANTGLEAGGTFVEHRNTVWRLQGTFSPAPAA